MRKRDFVTGLGIGVGLVYAYFWIKIWMVILGRG